MLAEYCSKLIKLKIVVGSKLDAKHLAKITSLPYLELQARWFNEGDLEVMLVKLINLEKLVINSVKEDDEKFLDGAIKAQTEQLMSGNKFGKRSRNALVQLRVH